MHSNARLGIGWERLACQMFKENLKWVYVSAVNYTCLMWVIHKSFQKEAVYEVNQIWVVAIWQRSGLKRFCTTESKIGVKTVLSVNHSLEGYCLCPQIECINKSY